MKDTPKNGLAKVHVIFEISNILLLIFKRKIHTDKIKKPCAEHMAIRYKILSAFTTIDLGEKTGNLFTSCLQHARVFQGGNGMRHVKVLKIQAFLGDYIAKFSVCQCGYF